MESMVITDPREIGEIEDEWRAIAERRSNIFITPEWFRSWWAHRGGSSTPLIVVVHRPGGSLAGVMPLVADTSKRPHAVRFAGATLGDRFHPVASEEEESAVAAESIGALERQGFGRHMISLERLDSGQRWWTEMPQMSAHRLATIEQRQDELLSVPLKGLDWEGYLARCSSNFRKKLRQRERALRRDHTLEVRSATEETLEADMAELFRLHALRWGGRSSALEDSSAKQVLAAFALAIQRRGWLRLRFLEVDGLPVAGFFDWRIGHRHATYQGGFDPAWSKQGVGIVLTAITIRMAIEEGVEEFDFLLGNEPYKRRFGALPHLAPTVVLTRAMHPTRLLVSAEAGARRYGQGLAARPGFRTIAATMRRLLPIGGRS